MEYRHELKFLVSSTMIEMLRFRLEPIMEMDAHQPGAYRIRSLYFDDIYDTCLAENLAGTDDRYKYRLRYYGKNLDYINLEKKYKLHGMTKKLMEQVSVDQVSNILSGDADICNGPLTTELYAQSVRRNMHPKCIVEYDRLAFVEPAGNVRVTFDMNLRGSLDVDTFLDADHEYTVPILPPGQHILEVKYDELLPRHILQLVDTNRLQRQSFSKYAMVRELLG